MPNDAKLGLLVGVGLVLWIAMVFFQKEPLQAQMIEEAVPVQASPPPSEKKKKASPPRPEPKKPLPIPSEPKNFEEEGSVPLPPPVVE